MAASDAAHPRRLVHDLDEGFTGIGLLEALDDLLAGLHTVQPQVGGEGDATEMRRDVRHEFDGHAELHGHLTLVHVVGQRVRHQVVGQQLDIVLVRRRGAGTGVAGHTETLRRARQQIPQRMDRQLHRSGVAARVADVLLAVVTVAGKLGQAVVPAVVETVVGRQVDDHRVRLRRFQRRHERSGQAVGQCQDHRIHALGGNGIGVEILELQFTLPLRVVVGHALPGQFARGDEAQLQVRMRGHQPDQLGAGMAAGADDADGERGGSAHACVLMRASRGGAAGGVSRPAIPRR
ncbi:hypothetical protein D3C73_913990 [compost metagenome]